MFCRCVVLCVGISYGAVGVRKKRVVVNLCRSEVGRNLCGSCGRVGRYRE